MSVPVPAATVLQTKVSRLPAHDEDSPRVGKTSIGDCVHIDVCRTPVAMATLIGDSRGPSAPASRNISGTTSIQSVSNGDMATESRIWSAGGCSSMLN